MEKSLNPLGSIGNCQEGFEVDIKSFIGEFKIEQGKG
jgi:hypothetical protein